MNELSINNEDLGGGVSKVNGVKMPEAFDEMERKIGWLIIKERPGWIQYMVLWFIYFLTICNQPLITPTFYLTHPTPSLHPKTFIKHRYYNRY